MDGKAESLKEQIKIQYKSVRQFALAMNMPYSTIAAALDKGDKGIDAMAYATVIAICEYLNLDPISFLPMEKDKTELTSQEKRLLHYYSDLNMLGRERITEQAEDMRKLNKYSR